MKTIILFLFFSGLVSAAPNGTIRGLPRMEDCADMPSFMRTTNYGTRIHGGENAPSPIPWQVSKKYGCSGTILDSTTVLSAAHCYFKVGEWIRAGSLKEGSGGQVRNIKKFIIHPEYNGLTDENDFAIFKLDKPFIFNKDVQPACLPPSKAYLGLSSTEEQCFTSGWGDTEEDKPSDTCKYVQVPAVTQAKCKNDYKNCYKPVEYPGYLFCRPDVYNPDVIADSMICAGDPEGGKDACQGDSGGPFICNNDGKAIIAGVVSWGRSCALPDYPGVYSRTTHVLDWIKAQMEETSPPPTDKCGSPEYSQDDWCDDDNNNAGCNWDDGACCDNENPEWDKYCTDCECLEPRK